MLDRNTDTNSNETEKKNHKEQTIVDSGGPQLHFGYNNIFLFLTPLPVVNYQTLKRKKRKAELNTQVLLSKSECRGAIMCPVQHLFRSRFPGLHLLFVKYRLYVSEPFPPRSFFSLSAVVLEEWRRQWGWASGRGGIQSLAQPAQSWAREDKVSAQHHLGDLQVCGLQRRRKVVMINRFFK